MLFSNTAALLRRAQKGCKDRSLYNANRQRRLKTSQCLLFSSWQIHHKVGGGAVRFLVLQRRDLEVGAASTLPSPPPHTRPFLSIWCLCQLLSVSQSFSNLIICFELYRAKASLCWLSRQARQHAESRAGLWRRVTNSSRLVLYLLWKEKIVEMWRTGSCHLSLLQPSQTQSTCGLPGIDRFVLAVCCTLAEADSHWYFKDF